MFFSFFSFVLVGEECEGWERGGREREEGGREEEGGEEGAMEKGEAGREQGGREEGEIGAGLGDGAVRQGVTPRLPVTSPKTIPGTTN